MADASKKKSKRQIREESLRTLEGIAATQQRLLELAEQQAEATGERIEQSIRLQEVAVRRQKQALWAGVPILLVCIGLIVFLIWRFL